uniref:Uncharacterized protein n=1 Tax=Anopheles farauti TaxID=69004 RepID=A0A182QZ52_9DIPT
MERTFKSTKKSQIQCTINAGLAAEASPQSPTGSSTATTTAGSALRALSTRVAKAVDSRASDGGGSASSSCSKNSPSSSGDDGGGGGSPAACSQLPAPVGSRLALAGLVSTYTTASYVAIMIAVFGICRTSCRPALPSSFQTVSSVCQKLRYLLPSSRSRVRATSCGYATTEAIVLDVAPAAINSRKSRDVLPPSPAGSPDASAFAAGDDWRSSSYIMETSGNGKRRQILDDDGRRHTQDERAEHNAKHPEEGGLKWKKKWQFDAD